MNSHARETDRIFIPKEVRGRYLVELATKEYQVDKIGFPNGNPKHWIIF